MHLIVVALVLGVLQTKCRAPELLGRTVVPPVQLDVEKILSSVYEKLEIREL